MSNTRLVMALAVVAAGCASETTAPRSLRPLVASRSIAASSSTVIVTPSDVATQPENTAPTKSWVAYTRNAGSAAFQTGPGTAPSGIGSVQLTTPTGSDKLTLFNFDHVGASLASLDEIAYSTYRVSGAAPNQVPAINLQVDYTGAGSFTTLVFEPVYNTAQGAIADGVWQRWTATGTGRWWSTRNIPGVCAFSCYATWDDILAANPSAKIVGGIGINQGSGNPALIGNADAFTFGDVTYDFEPYRVPTTTDQCKDGGWKTLRTAAGAAFTNQGDCVSYVAAGK